MDGLDEVWDKLEVGLTGILEVGIGSFEKLGRDEGTEGVEGEGINGEAVWLRGWGINAGDGPRLEGGVEKLAGELLVRGKPMLLSFTGVDLDETGMSDERRIDRVTGDGDERDVLESDQVKLSSSLHSLKSSAVDFTSARVEDPAESKESLSNVGGGVKVKIMPPSTSCPKNSSSTHGSSTLDSSSSSPSSSTTTSNTYLGAGTSGETTTTPTSEGSTNGGNSSSVDARARENKFLSLSADRSLELMGGELSTSSKQPKKWSTSSKSPLKRAGDGDVWCGKVQVDRDVRRL